MQLIKIVEKENTTQQIKINGKKIEERRKKKS